MTPSAQLVRWLRSACLSVVHAVTLSDSPWDRVPIEVPAAAFGPGSRCQFSRYFQGTSRVAVASIDDIVEWLSTCEYASDLEQFHEADCWQEPCAFEQRQRGDCEDFALWTWRKLVELGVDADLVIGRRVPPGSENSRHAWILFRDAEDEFLFEPIVRDRPEAIRRLATVRSEYIPEFGVARDRSRFLFAGYAYFLQNRHLGKAASSTSERVESRGAA